MNAAEIMARLERSVRTKAQALLVAEALRANVDLVDWRKSLDVVLQDLAWRIETQVDVRFRLEMALAELGLRKGDVSALEAGSAVEQVADSLVDEIDAVTMAVRTSTRETDEERERHCPWCGQGLRSYT